MPLFRERQLFVRFAVKIAAIKRSRKDFLQRNIEENNALFCDVSKTDKRNLENPVGIKKNPAIYSVKKCQGNNPNKVEKINL